MREQLFAACAAACLLAPAVPALASDIVLLDEACRLLDTRSGSPLAAETTYEVAIRGECGIPESALGIVFNLTVYQPASQGHLRAYGTEELASTAIINYNTGEQVVATGATVKLSTDDETTQSYDPPAWGMRLWSLRQTHVIMDVTAYVTELSSEIFHGFVTDIETGLGPTWTALEIDSLQSPFSLICQKPWIDSAECDSFSETDEVCGSGHLQKFGSTTEIFVHEITDCQ